MKKLSLYWICQLIGWMLFGLLCFAFTLSNAPIEDRFPAFLILIKLLTCGIAISHLMRIVIKKLNIMERHIMMQLTFLIIGTFSFAIAYIILFLLVETLGRAFFSVHFWAIVWFQF